MTADAPLYRVTAPTYLAGGYYTPESQPEGGLQWDGEPNSALDPLNASAEKRVKAYEEARDRREAGAHRPLSSALKEAGVDTSALERDRDAAVARADAAEEKLVTLTADLAVVTRERDELAAQVAKFDHDSDGRIGGAGVPPVTVDVVQPTPALAEGHEALAPAPQAIDDLAEARTTPGDSPEKLEAIEREVDEANGKLTTAQNAALDHDGDAKAGGSTPKAGRSAEEEAERAALFKFFKELDVKVFAGSTTEKLRAKKAEIEAATAP